MLTALVTNAIGSSAGTAIAEAIERFSAFGAGIKAAIILAGLVVAVEGLSGWLERRRRPAAGDRRSRTRRARAEISRRLGDRGGRSARRPLARPSPPR